MCPVLLMPRSAIAQAKRNHPERDYRVADICTDRLPRCDAVLCRDAFQHLSIPDGLAALANFRRTGARWLLASTHLDVNEGAETGGYYPANLTAAPFDLGLPERLWPDGSWDRGVVFPRKYFGAWRL